MEQNNAGQDIKQGFNAMADGVKEAGRRRTAELVKKNGYIAFRNPDAVAQFRADPYYANWNCKYVEGEYRFSPPEQEQQMSNEEDPHILETYKKVSANPTQITSISINMLENDPSKCKYLLSSIDKKTGERKVVQELIVDFNGKFSMEVIPSLYNQLCDGIPAVDYEKEQIIAFENIDKSKMMRLGNLNPEQMKLIENMKQFVDERNLQNSNKDNGHHM